MNPRLQKIQQMLCADPEDVFLNFSLAMEFTKAERLEEGLAQFARVRELDPSYIPAYGQQAQTLIKLNRAPEACRILEEGIAVARQAGNQHAANEMGQKLALIKGQADG